MALPCVEQEVLHEVQNYKGQLESSQISYPLKITSFLPIPNLLIENISFLKRAVYCQQKLTRTTWLKLRRERNNQQDNNNCNPWFATALVFGRLGCSFFPFQPCHNPTKKLPDKGILHSSSGQGTVSDLA